LLCTPKDFSVSSNFQVVAVDGVEERPVHFAYNAQGVERVVDASVASPLGVEHGRDSAELHVRGQGRDPLFQQRLERVAVRAAVPEELDHLDLALRLHRLAGLEFGVVHAGSGLARLGVGAERREAEREDEGAAAKIHLSLPLRMPGLSV
jgi:hypothetical protein